jgi:hypothetical protein
MRRLPVLLAALLALAPRVAQADTYEVGQGYPHANLQAVQDLLAPGDLVLVYGNATYPGGVLFENPGLPASPITIRGVRVNGNRPRIHGGADGVKFVGDHYVFEGFEVTGDAGLPTNRCLFPGADGIVIRDSVVHDCPRHGILGADGGSGNLTLEYVEVHHTGNGTQHHQVYVATDNTLHPTAVFRMRFCYIHDANGGNSVKSRAGRNEITYNWIEGALYHELDLIGADGQAAGLVREDSDVVGNVLVKSPTSTSGLIARIGGDGTGDSSGRFRFLNNTMILRGQSTAFRLQDHVESLELHNNVVYRDDGAAFTFIRTAELAGTCLHSGQNNWAPSNASGVRGEWTGTLTGTTPGFLDYAALDLRPSLTSPLHNAGLLPTTSPPGAPFPSPLAAPASTPPRRRLNPPGSGKPRPAEGTIDIGAWEATPQGPRGDQNADGRADLLLRNTSTNEHQVWLMNGVARVGSPLTVSPSPGALRVVAGDDFNANGYSDLVLRDPTTGVVEFWLMNGATRVGAPLPLSGAPSPPVTSELAATGDFNKDGRPDLLWRDLGTQAISIWLMNGATRVGTLTPTPNQAAHSNWSVTAAYDYDNDGNRDLLWYNATTGKIVLWRMDANVVRTSGDFTVPANAGDANWKVVAGGDYGPGPGGVLAAGDIVWRNDTSGRLVVWHMDPESFPLARTTGQFTSPDAPSPNPLDWRVVGPR